MIFKNQRTSYFSLRALTIHANESQDHKGYWTKVHDFFTRRRGIIVDANATIRVAIRRITSDIKK